MANILQNQYSSVFTQPLERYDLNENDNNTSQLCDIDLTEADFINEINTLSSNSAPGPDGFPAILLKKARQQLATPLCLIWRNILDKSQTPHLLKSATSHQSSKKAIKLQDDMNAVHEWTGLYNMKLNGLKFEHLNYGRNEELKELSKYFSDTQKESGFKQCERNGESSDFQIG
ncbi:uncharacterized protein [Clytia hemisphaerica]|uniref:uncharacterized protein n=1 Tax=Clytia hemisphaerica TaxID=252671 RepID=UPI0034D59051